MQFHPYFVSGKRAHITQIEREIAMLTEQVNEKFEELNNELQKKLQAANNYRDTLIGKLRKHNLLVLSLKKPKLVEKKINNGTKKLFESFEAISGAIAPPPSGDGVQQLPKSSTP